VLEPAAPSHSSQIEALEATFEMRLFTQARAKGLTTLAARPTFRDSERCRETPLPALRHERNLCIVPQELARNLLQTRIYTDYFLRSRPSAIRARRGPGDEDHW
jgi:hypothetical protein